MSAGKIGNAAGFVRSAMSHLSNSDIDLGGGTALTIAGWIKLDNNDAPWPEFFGDFSGDTYWGGNGHGPVTVYYDSIAGELGCMMSAASYPAAEVRVPIALAGAGWVFVCIRASLPNLSLYARAVGGAACAATSTTAIAQFFPKNIGFTVGITDVGFQDGYFDGAVDSLSTWNRTLTDAEVTALYNSGNGLDYESFAFTNPVSEVQAALIADLESQLAGKESTGTAVAEIIALNLGTAATNSTTDFATSAQGALADTALQDASAFATATQGQAVDDLISGAAGAARYAMNANYADALTDPSPYATAEQGGRADTALQPGDFAGFPIDAPLLTAGTAIAAYSNGELRDTVTLAASAIQSSTPNSITVSVASDDATANGAALLAAYAAASALTPNGAALSASNRATLYLPAGHYSLASEWDVNTSYVDIVGLGTTTKSPSALLLTNTINVTAADVRVSGIVTGELSFKVTGAATQVFENCTAGDYSFGGVTGTASGTFIHCRAGSSCYGLTASGTFILCTGGAGSFGNGGTASGTFTDCRGLGGSFGGGGTCSGTFDRCVGGSLSFGGNGTISSAARLYLCRLTSGAFVTPATGGILRECVDGSFNLVEFPAVAATVAQGLLAASAMQTSASIMSVTSLESQLANKSSIGLAAGLAVALG